jgi:hypothetical protein
MQLIERPGSAVAPARQTPIPEKVFRKILNPASRRCYLT